MVTTAYFQNYLLSTYYLHSKLHLGTEVSGVADWFASLIVH